MQHSGCFQHPEWCRVWNKSAHLLSLVLQFFQFICSHQSLGHFHARSFGVLIFSQWIYSPVFTLFPFRLCVISVKLLFRWCVQFPCRIYFVTPVRKVPWDSSRCAFSTPMASRVVQLEGTEKSRIPLIRIILNSGQPTSTEPLKSAGIPVLPGQLSLVLSCVPLTLGRELSHLLHKKQTKAIRGDPLKSTANQYI